MILDTCPIAQLVAHSEEHFIDRRSEGPADETFEQLAERRAGNLDLLMRFLDKLAEIAPNDRARYSVNGARDSLLDARNHLRCAAGEVITYGV